MDIQNFETAPPTLALERYFAGNTCAWGIFEDRFGTLRRQFTVDIDGQWDGHTLVLDEHFVYRNGEKDQRVWTIEKLGPNRYKGHANDVIGSATGAANGNAFSWHYNMNLKVGDFTMRVRFDDWMFLQPDNILINRTRVSKWGVELGQVTLFFSKSTLRGANSDEPITSALALKSVGGRRTAASR
ncbi:MAG: hypothetical protein CMM55_16960 [Rhodospirillaceae bacterium]|nr:hypothetical protein [Rhodospirillaceae bacterium]|tara:strand:+ start:1749 stop:2303 length:555 start_codon:yes stop_codon:yes gene_type:complete